MKYMLDTNISMYLIKQKPLQVLRQFQAHSFGDIGVSTITVAELQYGANKSQYIEENQKALGQFLIPLEIADFDHQASINYGEICAYLKKKVR